MIAGVADTHTALWYLLKNPRLSATACRFMDDAASAGNEIVLSPVSLAEIVYPVEKGRLPASAYDELRKALNDPDFVLEEARLPARLSKPCARSRAKPSRTCPTGLSQPQPCILVCRSSVAMAASALPTCNSLVKASGMNPEDGRAPGRETTGVTDGAR